jgi:hypothetical protein
LKIKLCKAFCPTDGAKSYDVDGHEKPEQQQQRAQFILPKLNQDVIGGHIIQVKMEEIQ